MLSGLILLATLQAPDPTALYAGEQAAPVADPQLLYLPGEFGLENGALAPDVASQTRRTLENIEARLAAEGLSLRHVVASNVYLADSRHFSEMNAVYRTFFPEDPPTRATVQSDLPLPGALVQIAVVAAREGVERRVIRPSALRSPELPYSWGVFAGTTLFVAGATSRDPSTYQPVPGDIAAQTRRVLGNIGMVLDAGGLGYDDVVSCTVFLDDARDFQAMNAEYRTFFPTHPPGRATVRATLMNSAFDVEIQCVATAEPDRAIVIPPGIPRSASPFSPAVSAGGRLHVAGMVGRGPAGYAPGDVEAQTRQTVENIRAALVAGGVDFDRVVDARIYVTDIRSVPAVTEVLDEILGPAVPRTVVGNGLMSNAALIEIVVTAVH